MVYKPTGEISKARLISELHALGMDAGGARSELVSRLMQAGVYQINADSPPPAKFVDTSCRFPNHSSVLIGNGAQISTAVDEKLTICNRPKRDPLIEGDFKKGTVSIRSVLTLNDSDDLNCDTPGEEGDIRRCGDDLFMYRSSSVHPGWYPVNFGTMLLM